jgi:site-specific DNA-methyltransferase (cytosine-N4-specific)
MLTAYCTCFGEAMIKANALQIPLKDKSVQSLITSPPYWGLRKYDVPDVGWGGDEKCEHDFSMKIRKGVSGGTKSAKVQIKGKNNFQIVTDTQSGFCTKCHAWQGQLGLEPTPGQYITHLMQVMAECWRVLRDDGVCFVNLGDTYGGSWGNFGAREGKQRTRKSGFYKRRGQPDQTYKPPSIQCKPKSLCLIPERFVIACQEQGWIIRNSIIWYKRNAMPSSVKDRFNVAQEKIFMMSKRGKYYFNLDAVRERHKGVTDEMYEKAKQNPYHGKGDLSAAYKYVPGNLSGKNPGDVWDITTQGFSGAHFATFPERLAERMILCSTRPGDIVCDPFGGSGTVGRVAIRLRRKPVLLDLGYHDQQAKRLNNVQLQLL